MAGGGGGWGMIMKVLLQTSAIGPVFAAYGVAAWLQDQKAVALIALVAFLISGLATVAFLCLPSRKSDSSSFKVEGIETADHEVSLLLVAFILPLLTDQIANMNWSALVPCAVLLFSLACLSNGFNMNPMLSLLGYHFYRVETPEKVTRLLISRDSLQNVKNVSKVVELTEYMLLDVTPKRGQRTS
jgi:hypothetical protein